MLNNVTIFDLETTGLNENDSEVIEFGAILYSIKHGTILSQVSSLIPVATNPAYHINGIDVEAASLMTFIKFYAVTLLEEFVGNSDYIVAHCKKFDMSWKFANTLDKKWLCTYDDFVWPKNQKPASLIQTALNHGLPVVSAHRALTDCNLIASLFSLFAEKGELNSLLDIAIKRSEDVVLKVVALVSFDDRQKAKDAKFFWDRNIVKSQWVRFIKQSEFEAESKYWNFKFQVVES